MTASLEGNAEKLNNYTKEITKGDLKIVLKTLVIFLTIMIFLNKQKSSNDITFFKLFAEITVDYLAMTNFGKIDAHQLLFPLNGKPRSSPPLKSLSKINTTSVIEGA